MAKQAEQVDDITKSVKSTQPKKSTWEIKDRSYLLTGGKSPLTHTIKTRHSQKKPLLWFDEKNNEPKEIRYATNQKSLFVDEQKGHVTLGHVIFTDGGLFVPRTDQALQKLLSIYHPKANKQWSEVDRKAEAVDELEVIGLKLRAQNLAMEIDLDHLEAIMRAEFGSTVSKLSSKELKRDAFNFASSNSTLFIELAEDEDIQLRNTAIKAVERGILSLTDNNTTFKWGATGKKVMTVPFDDNAYSAMASYFKTDEGVDTLRSIEKKLK